MARFDGGDLVARTLKQEDIECIFILCGGDVMNIYNGCLDQGIRVADELPVSRSHLFGALTPPSSWTGSYLL